MRAGEVRDVTVTAQRIEDAQALVDNQTRLLKAGIEGVILLGGWPSAWRPNGDVREWTFSVQIDWTV